MKLMAGLDDSRMKQKFKRLDDGLRAEILKRAVLTGGVVVLTAARQNILAQALWKTRALSRSLHQEGTEATATSAQTLIGTNLVYAALHEYGGIVTPKNAKYLAIPVNGATGSPRDRADLKLIKARSGSLVLVDESGVQFVLKDSVTIPARPYLRPAMDENVEKILAEIKAVLQAEIEAAWK
jgi:phage gpG-like protein